MLVVELVMGVISEPLFVSRGKLHTEYVVYTLSFADVARRTPLTSPRAADQY
jgi:hypothetical protein